MAEAIYTTYPQDNTLINAAFNAKQIVPINISKIVNQGHPLTEQLWLGAWNIAYLMIEYANVDNTANSSYDRYGLNYLHLLTLSTTNMILSGFGESIYGGYTPIRLGVINTFRINCDSTSINAYCASTSSVNITFTGKILIME